MTERLTAGLQGRASTKVTERNTATHWGSGELHVFSTPHMVALMECAAVDAVDRYLSEGHKSVGTVVNVRHLASTPVGNPVEAHATLVEVDGRRLLFDVVAYSADVKIGDGSHERFVVQVDRFMERTNARREGDDTSQT